MTNATNSVVVHKLPLPTNFDLADLAEHHPEKYPFLLESVAKSQLGAFDILFAKPEQVLQLHKPADYQQFAGEFLQQYQQNFVANLDKHGLPFIGGWLMFFGYEYAQAIFPELALHSAQLPIAFSAFCSSALIIDHQNQQLCLLAKNQQDLAELTADYQAWLQQSKQAKASVNNDLTADLTADWQLEADQDFIDGVLAIQQQIRQQQVLQVNLSRKWQTAIKAEASTIYRALRQHNPAPFSCLANFPATEQNPKWSIISSSPERLVRVKDGWVETRPIGGTRKRSLNPAQDAALLEELRASLKEQTEHQMLIELEISDLAKICEPDSIEVNEQMVVESYQHVHHLVSNVRGKPKNGLNPLDIINAMFPGGSITGEPKLATMKLISQLETSAREAYTGSIGYLNYDGSLDFNILIRSFILQNNAQPGLVAAENQLSFRTGAGIILEANPQQELKETLNKAKGLLDVFQQEASNE